MSNHTQGKWEVNKTDELVNGLKTTEVFKPATFGGNFDGEWVARVRGNTNEIREANATLIAAAPKMYEALNKAPIVSKYSNAEEFITDYEKWRDEYKLPAIKKVEGE